VFSLASIERGEEMHDHARILLAANTSDVGPGELWPSAVLAGAATGAATALGAWCALEVALGRAPVGLGDWIALHASVGLLGGVLVTWILALGRRFDVALERPEERRAAAVRLSSLAAAATSLCFGFSMRPDLRQALALLAGLGIGAGIVFLAGNRVFGAAQARDGSPLAPLRIGPPRLDPLRVAAFVALLLVPLQDGVECSSLGEAWRVMLGR
jgi:hypothetical protein